MSSDRGAPEMHGLRCALMRQIVVEDLHKAYVISSYIYILRGTRNLSFVLRRSLLGTFETIWTLLQNRFVVKGK